MFKLYKTGNEFFLDNKDYLLSNLLETQFLIINSQNNNDRISPNLYFLKVFNDEKTLYAGYKKPFNLLLTGNKELIDECCDILINHNLTFSGILTNFELSFEFITCYSKKTNTNFILKNKLQIMYNDIYEEYKCESVKKVTHKQFEILCLMIDNFHQEVLNNQLDSDEIKTKANDYINNNQLYGVFIDDELIAIANRRRDFYNIASISLVYTLPEYRNQGYAQKLVKTLTSQIIKEHKTATLYVDQNNPYSNKAYTNIGYKYFMQQFEYVYESSIYETAILAGGCFWCMAKPYYEYRGILKVVSGYAGGNTILPTYEETKTSLTGHKEVVKITYNKNKISFRQILDIYFESIDPFDNGGQFIDRGDNYTTAIFITNDNQRQVADEKIKEIETAFQLPVYISILDNAIFYPAEEYHQDFHLKNPVAYNDEFKSSGRIKKPLMGRYFSNDKYYQIKVLDDEIIEKVEIKNLGLFDNPVSLLPIIDKLMD